MVDGFLVAITDLYEVNEMNRHVLGKVADKLTTLGESSSRTPCSSQPSRVMSTDKSNEIDAQARIACELSIKPSTAATQKNTCEVLKQYGLCEAHLTSVCSVCWSAMDCRGKSPPP